MKRFMLFLAAAMTMLLTGCSKEASSIGVIGGADGPTAVFVTGNYPLWFPVIIAVAIVAMFLLIFWLVKRNK